MHLRTLPKIMLALLAFIFSSAAFAQASDEVKNLLLASDKTGEMENAEVRKDLLDSAEAYCVAIEHEFPKNSPTEDEWLNSELRGTGNRACNAIASVEMVRRMAANLTGECLFFVNMARLEPNSAKGFIGLAIAFDKADGNLHQRAEEIGVDPEKFGFEFILGIATSGFLRAAYAIPD